MIESLQGEEWRDIPGYEGFYMASSLGRIKSLARWRKIFINQKVFKPEGILFQKNSSNGYKMVILSVDAVKETKTVHRLIASSFIPNPRILGDVNHKNGIKHDNRMENLEWMDRSQNIKHAYDTNLRESVKGTRVWTNILSEDQVIDIFHTNLPWSVIAKSYGVTKSCIGGIKNGKNWKHLNLAHNY